MESGTAFCLAQPIPPPIVTRREVYSDNFLALLQRCSSAAASSCFGVFEVRSTTGHCDQFKSTAVAVGVVINDDEVSQPIQADPEATASTRKHIMPAATAALQATAPAWLT